MGISIDKNTTYALDGRALLSISNAAKSMVAMMDEQTREWLSPSEQLLQSYIQTAVPIDPDVITRPEAPRPAIDDPAMIRSADLLKRLFKDGHDAASREPDQLSGDAWHEYFTRNLSTAYGHELASAATAIARGSQPATERADSTRAKLRAVIESGIQEVAAFLDAQVIRDVLMTREGVENGPLMQFLDEFAPPINSLSSWAETASECLNAEQRERSSTEDRVNAKMRALGQALSSQRVPSDLRRFDKPEAPFTDEELATIVAALEEADATGLVPGNDQRLADRIRAMLPDVKLPPDPDHQNDARAEWARVALHAFMQETGTDDEDAISDLLCDLMHLCDRRGEGLAQHMERAEKMYADETSE